MSDYVITFVNGFIAGAGIILAIMSFVFLSIIGPEEGIEGITTTEVRFAIFAGVASCAVAIGYEYYRKKGVNDSQTNDFEVNKDQKNN